MNFSLALGAKVARLALVAVGFGLGVAAFGDSYTLTVSAKNQNSSADIYFTGSSPQDVYITSFNGSLKDTTRNITQSLTEFYCVDTSDSISVPDAPYAVSVVQPATGVYAVAASLVTDFSPGYPGPVFNGNSADLTTLDNYLSSHGVSSITSSQLDAGLQLALWETVNGVTSSSDSTLNKVATEMIAINNGASNNRGILLQEQGGDGQSMLYVPGLGGPTPAPEPFTMAIGAAGIGMFLARRKSAKK